MDLFFLPCLLFIALLSVTGTNSAKDWDDVVVTKVNMAVTLACSDWPIKGSVKLEWLWKPVGRETWSLVLSANERQEFRGGASKVDLRLADPRFQTSGDFSLYFKPRANDGGRYSCVADQGERTARQRVTLLAILTVTVSPTPPVPMDSTLRLIADVSPPEGVSEVAWYSPQGLPLRFKTTRPGVVICKLPLFRQADQGNYTCQIRPRGGINRKHFLFTYRVTADVSKAAKFSNLTRAALKSLACVSRAPVTLPCVPLPGDYVFLYWQHPDHTDMDKVFSYDRWRRTLDVQTSARLRLANPDAADSGRFSFLLEPEVEEGGVYLCEVFLNDNVFIQGTRLSVLKVHTRSMPSTLILFCQYSERSQVKQVSWTHQNQSYRPEWSSSAPGRIRTDVPLPLQPHLAGNYTCTMEMKNGKVVRETYTVRLPPTADTSLSSPSVLSPISGLGLLVPLVAVAVGVLLWKRGHHNTRPGVQQSLSHQSGEAENVYENPEDLRQTPGQSSDYMDLKPTSDDNVYKELDRYEQCPF